jgi:hypothetical protein
MLPAIIKLSVSSSSLSLSYPHTNITTTTIPRQASEYENSESFCFIKQLLKFHKHSDREAAVTFISSCALSACARSESERAAAAGKMFFNLKLIDFFLLSLLSLSLTHSFVPCSSRAFPAHYVYCRRGTQKLL